MTSTVGKLVNDEWKGFGRNWSQVYCKTEEKYKNKISIRIANDTPKIQTKVSTEYNSRVLLLYCLVLAFWCESSRRNETANTVSDDGHIPCKHMWLN